MSLPIFQDPNQQLMLLQTKWKSQIDPVLANPLVDGIAIKNISLINGVTVVNHLLGRRMQGWILTDLTAAVTAFRSQPMNSFTLTLTCNGVATCNLWVY